MPVLSAISIARLMNCDRRLWDIVHKVAETFPVQVTAGWRGEKEQNECYAKHTSSLKWPKSKHNFIKADGTPLSLAVDLCPIKNGQADLHDLKLIKEMGIYVLSVAADIGIKIRWGWDWDKDGKLQEKGENDGYHFELT